MGNIYLLDCTLRDGGYINNWKFGYDVIKGVMKKLVAANLDVIECGYYSHAKQRDSNYSIYNTFDSIDAIIPDTNHKKIAVMINYGESRLEEIPPSNADSPIIRVCFHRKDIEGAFSFYRGLKEKGYKIYVQPMASLNYTDIEFVQLIQKTNELNPECFYIVDSFGALELRDFERFLAIADNNLRPDVRLGYHAHNNLQQAYGNAKYMVEQKLIHDIVIDASVYGMGRGAGNLNMELFASYLNREFNGNYDVAPLLDIIDEYLKPVFLKNYWGYSLPYYLSAKHNCHPNFAMYFGEKNTLSNKSMDELLASISNEDKARYSESVAEMYYQNFQQNYVDDKETCKILSEKLSGNDVLILATGASLRKDREKISEYISEYNPIVIGINQMAEWYKYDYLMCVSEKRFAKLRAKDDVTLLLSSNLHAKVDSALFFNYSSYLTDNSYVADNPVLMLLRLLHMIGINSVSIAGFDGYSEIADTNYFGEGMALGTSTAVKLRKNVAIRDYISKIQSVMNLNFITDSIYTESTENL